MAPAAAQRLKTHLPGFGCKIDTFSLRLFVYRGHLTDSQPAIWDKYLAELPDESKSN